jgi:hypothetical protein
MTRLLRAAAALVCAFGLSAFAQTVTVSGSNITDSTGTAMASGTITFTPSDTSGHWLSYKMGGHGQTLALPVTATVTNGAFSITLPDTNTTNPINVCFAVTVTDNVTGDSVLGPGYSCVQPGSQTANASWCTGSPLVCNFDNYVPNNPALPITTISGGGESTFNGGSVTNGITAPSLTAGYNNSLQLGTLSQGSYAALSLNASLNQTTIVGFVGSSADPYMHLFAVSGFSFNIGNTPLGNGCAYFYTNGGNAGLLGTTGNPCGGSTPVTVIASSGATQTLTFATGGDIVYDITLSANCTISITPPSTTGAWHRLILIIRPAGFQATLPTSSASLVWSGGSPVVPSTTAITLITFGGTGTAPVFGGI